MIPVGIIASGRSTAIPSVTKAYDATWHVKAQVPVASKAAAWDVTVAIPQTKDSAWKVYAQVTKTANSTWNVESSSGMTTVTASCTSAWDVLEAVSQSKAAAWNVKHIVAAAAFSSVWHVKVSVPQSVASAWDVLVPVPQSKASAWRVLAQTGATKDSAWNVASNRVAVTNTAPAAWHIKAHVSQSAASEWNVLEAVSQSVDSGWAIIGQATATKATAWKIVSQVTQIEESSWNVLAESGASSPAAFVNSATSGVDDTQSTTHVFSKPSGVVAGDLVIGAFVEWQPVTISSLPAGSTLIGQWSTAGGMNGGTIRMTLWAKAVGAETSYTVTSASQVWAGHHGVFYTRWDSSVALSTLVEASTTGTGNSAIPSVGTSVNGMSAAVWIAGNDNDGSGLTHTPPTGFTERVDAQGAAIATKDDLTEGTITVSGGACNTTTTWIVALLEVPGLASGVTLTSVTNTFSSAWRVPAQVTATKAAAWNIASDLVTVTSTKAVAWSISAPVFQGVSSSWNIASEQALYPFPASVSGRAILDQNGDPWFMSCYHQWNLIGWGGGRSETGAGTTPHSAFDAVGLTLSTNGINSILVLSITSNQGGEVGPYQNGRTWDGVAPWNTAIGQLNEPFWSRVDDLIDTMAGYGITVYLYLMSSYTLYSGTAYAGITNTQATTLGTALGNRYKNKPNLIWVYGADYFNSIPSQIAACQSAIAATGDTHLFSVEFYAESSTTIDSDNQSLVGGVPSTYSFSDVYSYNAAGLEVRRAYADTTKPVVFSNGHYLQSGDGTYDRHVMGDLLGWTFTSGSRGFFIGSESTWQNNSGYLTAMQSEWWPTRDYPATLSTLLGLSGWEGLAPSTTFVTSSRGTDANAIASGGGNGEYNASSTQNNWMGAAIRSDGKLAVLYTPVSRTGITVDTSMITGTYTVSWIDPTSGARTSTSIASSYNTPGNNANGLPNWYLVFEVTGTTTSVTASINSGWDVLRTLSTPETKASAWRVLAALSTPATFSSAWHVKAVLATPATKAAAWNISATGQVSNSVQSAWHVKATLATPASVSSAWDVLAALGTPAAVSSAWRVLAALGTPATVSSAWSIIGVITSTASSAWNISEEATAASFDAATSGGTTDTTSLSWSHTCAANANLLIVAVSVGCTTSDATASTSVTYNGVSMTSMAHRHSNDMTNGYVEVFELQSPATGSNTVAVTRSGGTGTVTTNAGAVSFIGAGSGTYTSDISGSGTSVPITVTGGDANGMAASFAIAGTTFTGYTQTLLWQINSNSNSAAGNLQGTRAAGGSSVAFSHTISGDDWASIVGVMIPSGSGLSQVTATKAAAWNVESEMAPIPVSFVASGAYSTTGDTTPLTLAVPSGATEGMALYAFIIVKPDTATVSATDWTEVYSSGQLGTGSVGTGTGPVRLSVMRRIVPAGGLSGNVDFTIGNSPNSYMGRMVLFDYDDTGVTSPQWDTVTGVTYTRTTASMTFGGTGSANLNLDTNDMIVFVSLSPDDASSNHNNSSNHTLTASGATLGTLNNLGTGVTTTGGDSSMFISYAQITAGPSTAAPVATLTSNSSETGGGVFLRIRALGI